MIKPIINKKMKTTLLFILLFLIRITVIGQTTTSPTLAIADQSLTITFNSAEESRLGYFTGDLYAHTGVEIEDKGTWQNVIGDWNQNDIQPKLTNMGNGIYELVISPSINEYYSIDADEQIVGINLVFRSSDGSSQTNDITIEVFQAGIDINLEYPENLSILETDSLYTFSANSTEEANLSLKVDDNLIEQITGKSISKSYTFDEPGSYSVIAIAESDGITISDTSLIVVRKPNTEVELPSSAIKGISYPDDQSVQLVLWAPGKSFVYLLCNLNNWEPNNDYLLNKDDDYFWIELNGLEKGKEYAFQYYIDGEIKIADPYTEKTCDPWNDEYIEDSVYPDLLTYPENKTENIASIFQAGQEEYQWTNPEIDMPSKEEMVIYELLIRDFDEDHTYSAVMDRLDYLEDLNINVLELMPVNEFEGNSSWGYNPSFYFAPDKYYGPKNTLKALINECHKRGIAVVIDMVLNHSYGQSPLVQMYMDNWIVTSDNPWYNVESNFENSSLSWGYDFNHDAEATQELVDSINSFWLNEYQVDGFRFDFTKGFSNTPYGSSSWGSAYDASRIANLKRMADEIWKRKPSALVICEHLADNSEETELANYGMLLWGNMNYNYDEAAMGYVDNSDLSWGYYASRGWDSPNLVTYQESHDEERLTYKCLTYGNSSGSYSTKDLDIALQRMELNAVFHLPLPGPKMIWQFGELGYDISIDENDRVGEKPILWEYAEVKERQDLFKVMAALNFLKQNYEEFSTDQVTSTLQGALKTYQLSTENNYAVAIGNFDVEQQSITVDFPVTGTWYNYFEQTTYTVSNTSTEIILEPGEYLLLSTRQFDHPTYSTVDVETIKSSSQLIYPNPAIDQVTIVGTGNSKVEIIDINGRTKYLTELDEELANNTIDVSILQSGIYMIKVINGQNQQVSRIIIQ
jgi:hypothetical protein